MDEQRNAEQMLERITRLRDEGRVCTACDLYKTRTNMVFGEGNILSPIVIVGEGPGEDEDKQARPFVGRSGRLLNSLLAEAGIRREDVWLTNVVKSRPMKMEGNRITNRPPTATEIKACQRWISAELDIIQPKIIIALGATAANQVIHRDFRMTIERGQWFPAIGAAIPPSLLPAGASGDGKPVAVNEDQLSMFDAATPAAPVEATAPAVAENVVWAMATFHPAYVIRQEGAALERMTQVTVNDFKAALIKLHELYTKLGAAPNADVPPHPHILSLHRGGDFYSSPTLNPFR